ncbi:V-type Ig domain protein [Flamingopox virus FGPVKD09]|uniref:V-type Ig domain protein n=1 Tax=Flamingopox virus FGPVKD09 TaxID=2059380 RepID=A0A2H4X2M6_9POXV|nr:V-type Ig domain protein [Flamingopox virus FGPVKD09]AUD40308.1 V-type Ig domain protein [Flamingopox virus FGPVKD09]
MNFGNFYILLSVICYTINANIIADIGSSVVVECKIPNNYSVDTVMLTQASSSKSNRITVPKEYITGNTCNTGYRTYGFTIHNVHKNDEGRYRCRFYLNRLQIYETKWTMYVIPTINAYTLDAKDNKMIYACNRSRSRLYDDDIDMDIIIGGVYISGGENIHILDTTHSLHIYTFGDKNYPDISKQMTCLLTFKGVKRTKRLTTYDDAWESLINDDEIHIV